MQMPTYTCDELLAVRDYLVLSINFPEDMRDIYSVEKVKNRYTEFGGIYSHVLPLSIENLNEIRTQSCNAIINCNATKLLTSGESIEDDDKSSFIMQMNVKRDGDKRFVNYVIDFVSKNVKWEIERKILEVKLKDRVYTLIRNDEIGCKNALCPYL